MSVIFINYRRDDSAAYAGRIYDRLEKHFGRKNVFMDIDNIASGDIFAEVIQEKLKTVKVALVLIGKDWLDVKDKKEHRRLDDSDDWVRLEITVLISRNIRIIPVLVDGAALPDPSALPIPIAPLTKRHAHKVSDTQFHADVDRLIRVLEVTEGIKAIPKPKRIGSNAYILVGGLIAAIFSVAVVINAFLGSAVNQTTYGGAVFIPFGEGDNVVGDKVIHHGAGGVNVRDTDIHNSDIALEEHQHALKSQETEIIAKLKQEKSPFKDCRVCPEMEILEFTPFHMGSNTGNHNERPEREVNIVGQFALSSREITWSQWSACVEDGHCPSLRTDQFELEHPVSGISWKEAISFTQWLTNKTNNIYRLPSEVEWEFAARFNKIEDSDSNHADIGSVTGSNGLIDLLGGSVWEWMADCGLPYQDTVDSAGPIEDPEGCTQRVLRGGSRKSRPGEVKAFTRKIVPSAARASDYGFRVARSM